MERPEFEALALEQLDAVYRMAYHLTHNADAAQDLVQEVYVRAFQPGAVAAFSPTGGGIRSWLFTICHNTFYTQVRRRARERGQDIRGVDRVESGETTPGQPSAAWSLDSFDWDYVDQELKAAIHDLSAEYREVLLLWGVENLKYREISVILGVPIGTVMSRLHRARQAVADRLAEHQAGHGRPQPQSSHQIHGPKTIRPAPVLTPEAPATDPQTSGLPAHPAAAPARAAARTPAIHHAAHHAPPRPPESVA